MDYVIQIFEYIPEALRIMVLSFGAMGVGVGLFFYIYKARLPELEKKISELEEEKKALKDELLSEKEERAKAEKAMFELKEEILQLRGQVFELQINLSALQKMLKIKPEITDEHF